MPLTAVRRSTHGGESRHTTYSRGVTGKMPGAQRRRKIEKDAIHGITRPAIRRLARRGGVKRISAGIYEDVRAALTMRLKSILRLCVTYVEHRGAKTITLDDVFFSLKRQGQIMYGYGLGSTMEPRVAARQSRDIVMRR